MLDRRLFVCAMLLLGSAVSTAPAALLTFEEITEATASQDANNDNRIDRPGALTSLVGTIDGITVTIRRQNGAAFDIIDNAAQRTISGKSKADVGESLPNGRWGTRSLDPFASFADPEANPPTPPNGRSDGLIIDFSAPVKVLSLLVGDFDMPTAEDDILRLYAFSQVNTSGSLLDTDAPTNLGMHASLDFNQKRLTVTDEDAGFRSVLLTAGAGMYMNGFKDFLSVFIDRIYFDANSIVLPEDIDSEFNNGDNVFGVQQQSAPEPASAALLVLGAAAVLTRRPRRA